MPEDNTVSDLPLELLAPAGDPDSLQAAIEAHADSVYLGLTSLNARRKARNFKPDELPEAVALAHAAGVRVYLTLNIDVAERELETAAQLLERARQAEVDAVLVRDPGLLVLGEQFPELDMHLSTQNCVTNKADVKAAASLGAARVVLAREMTLEEIESASSVAGVETEVFVQGALCFCMSGRCLMSSWVGGHSGNRGACTSPCRVPWSVDGEPAGTPISMHDLSVMERLGDLREAGVTALKIEGRMKNADWVRRAVTLYRQALAGASDEDLSRQVSELGDYTGRGMTSDYLDGKRDDLTGSSGRRKAAGRSPVTQTDDSDDTADGSSYRVEMMVQDRGIAVRCQCGDLVEQWTIPKTVVRRAKKAISIGQLLQWLDQQELVGCRLAEAATNDPEFLLVPRASNALIDRFSKVVHRYYRQRRRASRIPLTESVRAILDKPRHSPANRTPMGVPADRVRLEAKDVASFKSDVEVEAVIVEGLSADTVKTTRAACSGAEMIAALPSVFFDDQIPELQKLIKACARAGVAIEVNSWGGWQLTRSAKVALEGGPGLAVLNSLAAAKLAKLGMRSATLSPEADRGKLESVAANCPLPCSLVVFGRPPLMISRVDLPEEFVNRSFADRRGTNVQARRERGLWVFRPAEPFDLRDVEDDRIVVKHQVVDLVGSPQPLRDWNTAKARRKPPFHFNFDRRLH